MVCTLINNYLTRKRPDTIPRRQKWDFIQFNGPSQRTNYIFCNYYSKYHIELCCVTHLIKKKTKLANENNKHALDRFSVVVIFKSPKYD